MSPKRTQQTERIVESLNRLSEKADVELVEYMAARQMLDSSKRPLALYRRIAHDTRLPRPSLCVAACLILEARGLRVSLSDDGVWDDIPGYSDLDTGEKAEFRNDYSPHTLQIVSEHPHWLAPVGDEETLGIEGDENRNIEFSPLSPPRDIDELLVPMYRIAMRAVFRHGRR